MRISIKTDGGITQLGVMQKTDVIRSYQAQPKSSSDNLRSISDFQKILGHKVDRKDSSPSGNTVTYPADIRESEPSQSTVSRTDNDIDTSKYDGVTIQAPDELADIFHRAAEKYGVDEKLLIAIAYHESGFDPSATSSSGAMGIMQLMPGTASDQGVVDPYNAEDNIMGGAKLISYLMDHYDGNLDLAMAAYSNGIGTVSKYGGVPPLYQAREFVAYINKVYPDNVITQ